MSGERYLIGGVVHDQDRAVLGWLSELPCEPMVLGVGEAAVMEAGEG